MEKFFVVSQQNQPQTRNLKLNLPKGKHYALVAVKDGEKVLDTKCVVEHAAYSRKMKQIRGGRAELCHTGTFMAQAYWTVVILVRSGKII